MEQAVVAKLLRAVAKAIERMSADEVDHFIAELTSGQIRDKRPQARKPRQQIDLTQINNILARIEEADSRERGYQILDELQLSRRDLELIAKERNVHVMKEDKIPLIEQKLIESLIGSRLSSMAIRGK